MNNKIDEYSNFTTYRVNINLKNCYVISLVTLFFSLFLLIFNYTTQIMFLSSSVNLHIIFFVFNSLYVITYKYLLHKECKNLIINSIFYYTFLVFYFIFVMTISINSLIFSYLLAGYLLVILGISLFIFHNLLESLLLLLPSMIFYIYIMFQLMPNSTIMSINVTNIIIFNILSFICIRFKYISFYKSFNSDKDLSLTLKSLKEINYKLLESDKNRTDFFANMSHELKTPINVIYGAEQLLAQQFKNEDINIKKSETYVKSIKQNSYRLIRLLNNILDITKIDSSAYDIKLENIDIIYTVETIVDSVAEFIKSKGLNIIFDTNVEEKIIAIDEDKLERIILNLLSNAIKFTDAGGTIFINMYEEKDYMTISVKDTGIGIDDSMKKAIFDRFIQIDKSMSRNSEGSGIGLSLVKSLVNMHEGKINLISSPGEGSEFIISFPDIKINSFNDTNKFLIKKPHNNKISKIQVEFSDIYQ